MITGVRYPVSSCYHSYCTCYNLSQEVFQELFSSSNSMYSIVSLISLRVDLYHECSLSLGLETSQSVIFKRFGRSCLGLRIDLVSGNKLENFSPSWKSNVLVLDPKVSFAIQLFGLFNINHNNCIALNLKSSKCSASISKMYSISIAFVLQGHTCMFSLELAYFPAVYLKYNIW